MENENPNMNPGDQMSQMNMNNNPQHTPKSGMGSVIATIIIIALIILGGLYFWGKRIETERENRKIMSGEITTDETAAVSQAMKTQEVSNDDSLTLIEAELGETNTTSVDMEIQAE